MTKEIELIELAREMITQTGGHGAISVSNREAIKEFTGDFGEEVDSLIHHFYEINCKVDNGGAPILKEIIQYLAYCKNNRFESNYAIPPMESIKEVLEDRGITLNVLSELSKIDYEVLVDIMEVRKSVDEDIAYKLERALDIPSSFWINLERNYQSTLERNRNK